MFCVPLEEKGHETFYIYADGFTVGAGSMRLETKRIKAVEMYGPDLREEEPPDRPCGRGAM